MRGDFLRSFLQTDEHLTAISIKGSHPIRKYSYEGLAPKRRLQLTTEDETVP